MGRFKNTDTFASMDLAKSTGVAVGVPFSKPLCETWVLPGTNRAERFISLKARMLPWLLKHNPVLVFIEEPLPARVMFKIGATIETQIQLTGLVAVAEMICEQFGIPSKLVNRQLALGHFTGCTRYREEDGAKKACVVRCKQLGYAVEGYDQADAAAQWDYGVAHEFPRGYAMAGTTRPLPRVSKGPDDDQKRSGKRPKSGRRGRQRLSNGLPLFR